MPRSRYILDDKATNWLHRTVHWQMRSDYFDLPSRHANSVKKNGAGIIICTTYSLACAIMTISPVVYRAK